MLKSSIPGKKRAIDGARNIPSIKKEMKHAGFRVVCLVIHTLIHTFFVLSHK